MLSSHATSILKFSWLDVQEAMCDVQEARNDLYIKLGAMNFVENDD